ncbi:ABC transporter substrate binding protein [Tepidibacter hydrothermalis]|uniref:ABC transporter substrate binding protein n=1 Tax=Tepidibacter hydrothermalis TaxID=3036126 RepID=A0ABY8ECU5_9FIRM|nr:ABC transporter substrate binding protein [Tepidibacter hydrothermalis]WFD09409.1 ABC transporter substrate binding protein [Tepidibacter hydrothermalis]
MKKYIKVMKILILFLMFFLMTSFIYSEHKNRILLINSYNSSFPTFVEQIEGIKTILKEEEYSIDIEFMDSKRFFVDENIDNFYKSLEYKIYNQKKYDAVIASDDNAYNFVVDHQNKLFKNIPIVFLGVNNIENALKSNNNQYITGVVEKTSMKETIEAALLINKNANKVIALSDSTPSGQSDLDCFYKIGKEFRNLEFSDISLSQYSIEEFTEKLKDIKKDDIVILLSVFYKSANDEKASFDEGLKLVLENTQFPVYHLWYHGMGKGLIGGKIISHYEQGKTAANLVKDILEGKDIKNIPVITESPNKFIFDNNVLEKYRIDLNSLPKDSILINKKPTFYEKYKLLVWIMIGIFIILISLIVLLIMNIEKRKVQEKKIKKLAYYDILTGLPNRTYLNEKLKNELEISKTSGMEGVVFFIDVDNFKILNDTFGHGFGDEILIDIGKRFRELIGNDKFIARLGGDEFIILLKDINDRTLIDNIVNEIIGSFEKPFYIEEKEFYVTISIGVTLYPKDGDNLDELLKNADTAMYKAKDSGRARYVYFEKNMNEKSFEKMQMQNKLRNAIEKDELVLYYQPKVDLKNNKIIEYEALIRWVSPDYGFVSPDRFIGIAEESGLISKLGAWVFEKACEFSKKINKNSENDIIVSVNVSVVELMNVNYISAIKKILEKIEVNPNLIGIEITETALMESFETNEAILNELIELGIQVSLDDFGTGYSSLNYLKKIPTNILKIDKSFVDDIKNDEIDETIIKAIIEIAHKLNLEVVAEGVETEEQKNKLKEYKCDQIQGYLVSKPLPEEDIIKGDFSI